MTDTRRTSRNPVKIMFLVVYLLFALGFGVQLLGFFDRMSEVGLRAALCGTEGCTAGAYAGSLLWLIGVIAILYVLPIGYILYAWLRPRKRNPDA